MARPLLGLARCLRRAIRAIGARCGGLRLRRRGGHVAWSAHHVRCARRRRRPRCGLRYTVPIAGIHRVAHQRECPSRCAAAVDRRLRIAVARRCVRRWRRRLVRKRRVRSKREQRRQCKSIAFVHVCSPGGSAGSSCEWRQAYSTSGPFRKRDSASVASRNTCSGADTRGHIGGQLSDSGATLRDVRVRPFYFVRTRLSSSVMRSR